MKSQFASKERVLTAFASHQPDRVPVNYHANAAIDRKLKAHFGLKEDDAEGLKQALGVDFRPVGVPYTGPKIHPDIPERNILVDPWGARRTWIEHESGGYWDICEYPLADADEETVANWPMPGPDDFDTSQIAAQCKQYGAYAVGFNLMADVINSTGFLRSMDQVFVDLITDDPAGILLIKRCNDTRLEVMRRALEAAKGGIDFYYDGEDLGTQRGPCISMEIFNKHIRPVHQPFIDLAKSHGIPTMMHTCGSSSWAYEEFIKMGVTVVDTLQPEAHNMSPAYLKKTFGGRLAFHGCISTAGPVAYGTVEDVVRDCRKTLDIMMPGGGYCFAPTHMLQDNSPVENVLAMYETAKKYGSY